MLSWLKTRSDGRRKARELYGAVVAQARNAEFYQRLGVADTPEGRYELIVLHLIFVLERLGAEGASTEQARRETLEAFVADMDDSIRELGAGEMSIPRKVKKAAGGVYERAAVFRAAIADADPTVLQAWIAKFVLQGGGSDDDLAALASYVRRCSDLLSTQPASDIVAGRVAFGDI